MKNIAVIALTCLLSACATPDHWGCQRPHNTDPDAANAYRACVSRVQADRDEKRKIAENPNYLKEKAEREKQYQQFVKWAIEAEKPGTSKDEFDYYHVPPMVQEVEDGNIVYRYSSTPPIMVVFKDDKLTTFKIDREVQAQREVSEQSARSANNQERMIQLQSEANRAQRGQNIINAINSSMQNYHLQRIEQNTR